MFHTGQNIQSDDDDDDDDGGGGDDGDDDVSLDLAISCVITKG